MRYSEEERRNSKINRAELDAYISSHYIEAGGLMGAAPMQAAAIHANMGAPAAFSAAASAPAPASSTPQAPTPVSSVMCGMAAPAAFEEPLSATRKKREHGLFKAVLKKPEGAAGKRAKSATQECDKTEECYPEEDLYEESAQEEDYDDEFTEELYRKLSLRVSHVEDSFSDYLMFLIGSKGMSNAEVYKRALVDKKVFSKIKNNPDYHPQKLTAMCLCIGAKLNLDESRDLLARAGYALSPCDKTDIIFQYFIEKGIYDMIELDIQLEEYGQPCIIA